MCMTAKDGRVISDCNRCNCPKSETKSQHGTWVPVNDLQERCSACSDAIRMRKRT